MSLSIASDLDRSCPQAACTDELLADRDRAVALANASNVTLAIAGAAAVTGALVWVFSGDDDDASEVGLGLGHAWWRASF